MIQVEWKEYSRMIQMNGTGGFCVQTQKPNAPLLANGEHSGQHGFGGAPSTDFSWEKPPHVPSKSP
jgi:hypothetical protein